jgi:hypothetical protein
MYRILLTGLLSLVTFVFTFCLANALLYSQPGTGNVGSPLAGPGANDSYREFLPVVASYRADALFDMTRFMVGDGRLYEVQHSSGSQARHQTQIAANRFYHTKGNEISAEWEELWAMPDKIFRGTDTSPGNGNFYTLYENNIVGSPWSPRFWRINQVFERNPYVVFYRKSDCGIVASGFQRSWLKFEAYYPFYTFPSGITVRNVIQLAWLLHPDGEPEEQYFYAEGFGLVGWRSANQGFSYVNEVHAPGQRPNNTREVIHCEANSLTVLPQSTELNFGLLPPPYRAK